MTLQPQNYGSSKFSSLRMYSSMPCVNQESAAKRSDSNLPDLSLLGPSINSTPRFPAVKAPIVAHGEETLLMVSVNSAYEPCGTATTTVQSPHPNHSRSERVALRPILDRL